MRRKDEFEESVAAGRANVEAIELTRRHCRHARIELVNGNSFVGTELGLPMGLLEVRCEHAPPPRTQGHRALHLAVEFYKANCTACPYRDGTGELPNLATAAAEHAAEQAAQHDAERRLRDEHVRRHQRRRQRRHQVLAGEGYVVRDLAAAVDRIDRAEPPAALSTPEEQQASRHVLDTARAAPELFRPVLVDSLLELAADTAEPTAFTVLEPLVAAGRCPPRRALEAALAALRRHRSVEAARLVALLEPELQPDDLPDVVDQLIALASSNDSILRPLPSSPGGLIAASRVDLQAVTGRILAQLTDDNEQAREAAADAARVLLAQDATRVVALGRPLAASVRGQDRGYAGYPHPNSSALRALAQAWRGEPHLTRRIVEAEAVTARGEAREQLARVPWFLQRFREPWDASPEATAEAISFLAQRVAGDWGDEPAGDAARNLEDLALEIPDAAAAHVDELLGVILSLCSAPNEARIPTATTEGTPPWLAAIERQSTQFKWNIRIHHLAEAIGHCAAADTDAVLGSVQDLFMAETGDDDHDRVVRTTMLSILETAASPQTLRDLLPITYTALLHNDQAVRSAGIKVWAACTRVADSLPAELAELSVPLLEDSYVIVHQRMLDQLPQLRLPPQMAPRLLPIAVGWLLGYAEKAPPEPDVVESAIWAIRSLASHLDDDHQASAMRIALRYVGRCSPYDRERLLTAWWPDVLRADPAWVEAALATIAEPELADYYNQRDEPLVEALFDQPQLVATVPLAELEPISKVHGTAYWWRALELVELLQSAGRWAEAALVAQRVEAEQPPGAEGAPARRVAGAVARGAELAEALVESPSDGAAVADLSDALTSATVEVESSLPDGVDGQLRATLNNLRATAAGARLLLVQTTRDPSGMADALDEAAGLLLSTPATHASGAQRQWIARAWQIAALLLRYDAAVRAVDDQAAAVLQAVKRRAEVLRAELCDTDMAVVPKGLVAFLAAAEEVTDPATAEEVWRRLAAVPAPISLVGTSLRRQRPRFDDSEPLPDDPPRAVCVATLHGVPVTDTLVVRPGEIYHLGLTVRLLSVPEWAEQCVIEPVAALGRNALTLPRYEVALAESTTDTIGVMFRAEGPLHCGVQQPIREPALDCPLQARLIGRGSEQTIEVAGLQRLRLRPFDPSRDRLTDHEQTDSRLLAMFEALNSPQFDTEDVRAFCRLYAACVRAAQLIMFERTFMRGSRVSEQQFHDELERLLSADPELGGRLTRRDAVGGGFDDLLHDDVIAELKVSRGKPVTVDDCVRYIGQPTQYGVGRGSQLSVLVVFDHGRKQAPPGVIDNYLGWLKPRLHGLEDPRYPSLVGVLIVNTNLGVPSDWSRKRIEAQRFPPSTQGQVK